MKNYGTRLVHLWKPGYEKSLETKGPREKVCSRDDMWSTVFDFFLCANFALGLTTIRWLSNVNHTTPEIKYNTAK